MSDDKAEVQYQGDVETNGVNGATAAAPAKGSFFKRVGTHYKRWWWVHVIIIIIIVLVVTLPVVYVGYPRIAQGDVNDSTLNITQMTITDPAPDSFQLNQTEVIGSHSKYHPDIYGFNATVSLAGSSVPFAFIATPKVKSKDGATMLINERVQLNDVAAFGDYAKAVMLNEEVSMNIYGRPYLKEGGLPKKKVTYNKTVTMKALNKLKGFNVTEFQILTTTNPDGTNTNGTLLIPNASAMTLEMGNLTMDLSVAGSPIGQAFIRDLTLYPGDNTPPMVSKVNETLIISLLTQKNTPYSDGIVPVDIVGRECVFNGQNLTYFTEALASNKLTVNLNVGKALAAIGITTLGGGGSL